MTHEEAFIADILDHPDDDAPRLIFADWLEEEGGDPDRAEFVRALLAVASPATQDKRPHYRRARELLKRHAVRWYTPLARLVLPEPYEPWLTRLAEAEVQYFPRGFLDQLTIDTPKFVANHDPLLRLAPVVRLALRSLGGNGRALAACPALRWMRELKFVDYYRQPMEAQDMIDLANSPHLGRLRHLNLHRNNIGDVGLRALVRSPWIVNLVALDLTENGLSEAGLTALASTPAPALRQLRLNANAVGDAALAALEAAPWLGQLEELGLSDTGVTKAQVRRLQRFAPAAQITAL